MPTNLRRYYGAGYLHFITSCCYHRRALLGGPQNRDLFLEVMEQVRRRYRFVVVGYVGGWPALKAIDLAGTTNKVGGPSFACFAKGGYRRP